MTKRQALALYGGPPLRAKPLPSRSLFGRDELRAVIKVFRRSWATGRDFGYQDFFEKEYTHAFCDLQGGGYADAVSSGTAAILLSLASLELPLGGEVVYSPVTDPGGITPSLWLGLSPVLADARPDGFNVGFDQFSAALSERTRAAVITHVGGLPVDIEPIAELCARRGIFLVEDCSQSHGATVSGVPVGNFGKVAAFSTMFSKNHASGGCGGLVFTRERQLYDKIRSLADRGKPFHSSSFNPKDPRDFLFPAMNFNQDELSCSIGLSTLHKLKNTIWRRTEIMMKIHKGLENSNTLCVLTSPSHFKPSPFFITVRVAPDRLSVPKEEFARAVAAEGISVNPDYRYVVSEWPWFRMHTNDFSQTPNATRFREMSFNILFNERFTDVDVQDVIGAIKKVESAFAEDNLD